MSLPLITKYFDITKEQETQFEKLMEVFADWNSKVNLVSRKDMENLEERHLLHSLAIVNLIEFRPGTKILDVGTGGGMPGLPLAIMFPECEFMLVDSIGKKIRCVQDMIEQIGLKNVRAQQIRAEELKMKFDFVVSRAVTAMPRFVPWVQGKFLQEQKNSWPNGIFYLKGGDLEEELAPLERFDPEVTEISNFYDEEFFDTKAVVYLRMV